MKNIIVCLLLVCVTVSARAEITRMDDATANRICDAIYKVEGGDKTRHPYGVLSVKTNGNKEVARRICLNTINNNFKRWEKTDKSIDYLTFLANVYCPKSADSRGNKNWIKNIHSLVK